MNQYGDKKSNNLIIPSRWLHCPRRGNLVDNKFLPFKTPLDSKYDNQLSEEFRFPVSMFLTYMQSQDIKVGFWIDLTNTNRFYNKAEVEKSNTCYVKLQCRGHGECPSEDQTQTFIGLCENFLKIQPSKVIAVHCTHGFNRTGFLICAYLVEKLSWSIDAAVQAFAEARPPGIYKEDYLQELFSRYGDSNLAITAPPLPSWSTESDDSGEGEDKRPHQVNGSDEINFSSDHGHHRRREFVKKNPTFMEGVIGVTPIVTQPLLTQIQRQCQLMCKWKDSGFPGSQPISMDLGNIKLLKQKPYQVSWKADGTRYMMLIDGLDEVYMIDRDNVVFKVPNLRFPKRKNLDSNLTSTLLDGEMIIDKVQGKNIPRYLVYDVVKLEGKDTGKEPFINRWTCIFPEIIGPRHTLLQKGKIDKNKEPFSVRRKDFWELSVVKKLLLEQFSNNVSHEIDGLIFQPKMEPYSCGRCLDVLKWKPPSLNSVDFKLMIKKIEKEGMLRETNGYLFVGGLDHPFSFIKLAKDLKQYDGKIIECTFENKQWKFLRERTDKSFPNSYSTAMAVCNSIQVPVTKELLLEHIDAIYATTTKEPEAKKHPCPTDKDLMPPPKQPKLLSAPLRKQNPC